MLLLESGEYLVPSKGTVSLCRPMKHFHFSMPKS